MWKILTDLNFYCPLVYLSRLGLLNKSRVSVKVFCYIVYCKCVAIFTTQQFLGRENITFLVPIAMPSLFVL